MTRDPRINSINLATAAFLADYRKAKEARNKQAAADCLEMVFDLEEQRCAIEEPPRAGDYYGLFVVTRVGKRGGVYGRRHYLTNRGTKGYVGREFSSGVWGGALPHRFGRKES